jgi:hypothetical protein
MQRKVVPHGTAFCTVGARGVWPSATTKRGSEWKMESRFKGKLEALTITTRTRLRDMRVATLIL